MRARPREENAQQLDTVMLQRKHWNRNCRWYQTEYTEHWGRVPPEPEITQAMMMATHWSLEDGVTKMERERSQVTAMTSAANLKERTVVTHSHLTSSFSDGPFGPDLTLYADTYRDRGLAPTAAARIQWTNFKTDGDERRFTKTARDAFQSVQADAQDLQVAHDSGSRSGSRS
jgi:hypothetical protein